MNAVPMTVAVDAKDVHDKGNSDTASYGSQKSLAFTVAWIRSVLRRRPLQKICGLMQEPSCWT